MQDFVNVHYKAESAAQRGTLYNIRDKFGHRGVKTKIADCINKVVDLMRFTNEGLCSLLAMKLCGLENQEDRPPNCPCADATEQERKQYIHSLALQIVEEIWPDVDQKSLEQVWECDAEEESWQYCVCGMDPDEG